MMRSFLGKKPTKILFQVEKVSVPGAFKEKKKESELDKHVTLRLRNGMRQKRRQKIVHNYAR